MTQHFKGRHPLQPVAALRHAKRTLVALACLGVVTATATADNAPAAQQADLPATQPATPPATAPDAQPAAQAPGNGNARQIVLDTPATAPAASATELRLHAAALGDLGLALLKHDKAASSAPGNAVVSPLSVASAMGLVHAGAAGQTRRELALLLSSGPAADRGFTRELPGLLAHLRTAAGQPPALQVTNRAWVHAAAAAGVPQAYLRTISQGYDSDLAPLDFSQPAAAVEAINSWAKERTAGRIPSIVSTDSINAQTRVVLTNAVHFKQPWAKPFDAAATRPLPFAVPGGGQPVPTKSGLRTVLAADRPDGSTVYELPFEGDRFSVLIVLPAAGAALTTLESTLSGADLLELAGAVSARNCMLQLPRLNLRREPGSLRSTLQALGVVRAFAAGAEFTPMLGEANARDLYLSDVLHAASFVIDEAGGEAAAATAATMGVRSAAPLPRVCAVDRPFIYVLRDRTTGAPLFIGRVNDPRKS